MECPMCGGEMFSGACIDCGYTVGAVQIEKGRFVGADVIVDGCAHKPCCEKRGDTTKFCKFLANISQVSVDTVIVSCDPVFKGEAIQ